MEKDIFFEKELEMEIEQQMKKLQKPQRLNMTLIREVTGAPKDGGADAVAAHLAKVVRLRLDFQSIPRIEKLDFFADSLRELYLQGNNITKIEGLDCLVNLEFLALQSNKIVDPIGTNLMSLSKLQYLNLAENKISAIKPETELPPSLVMLNLSGNPVSPPAERPQPQNLVSPPAERPQPQNLVSPSADSEYGSGKALFKSYRANMARVLTKLKLLDEIEVPRESGPLASYEDISDSSSSVHYVTNKSDGQKQLDDIMAKACDEIESFYGTRREELSARMEAMTAAITRRCKERAEKYAGSMAAIKKKRDAAKEAEAGEAKQDAPK